MAGRSSMHSENWWATQKPAHVLRCTADLKSTGTQCRREAHPGTNVCMRHGANIPAVQAAAARRIQVSVEDAAKALRELAFDENGDPRVRLKAIQDLLDRGGLAATSKVLVGVVTDDPVEKLFNSLLADPSNFTDRDAVYVKQIEPDRVQAALDGDGWDDIVEAEVVEQPEEPENRPSRRTAVAGEYKTPKHIQEALDRLI